MHEPNWECTEKPHFLNSCLVMPSNSCVAWECVLLEGFSVIPLCLSGFVLACSGCSDPPPLCLWWLYRCPVNPCWMPKHTLSLHWTSGRVLLAHWLLPLSLSCGAVRCWLTQMRAAAVRWSRKKRRRRWWRRRKRKKSVEPLRPCWERPSLAEMWCQPERC